MSRIPGISKNIVVPKQKELDNQQFQQKLPNLNKTAQLDYQNQNQQRLQINNSYIQNQQGQYMSRIAKNAALNQKIIKKSKNYQNQNTTINPNLRQGDQIKSIPKQYPYQSIKSLNSLKNNEQDLNQSKILQNITENLNKDSHFCHQQKVKFQFSLNTIKNLKNKKIESQVIFEQQMKEIMNNFKNLLISENQTENMNFQDRFSKVHSQIDNNKEIIDKQKIQENQKLEEISLIENEIRYQEKLKIDLINEKKKFQIQYENLITLKAPKEQKFEALQIESEQLQNQINDLKPDYEQFCSMYYKQINEMMETQIELHCESNQIFFIAWDLFQNQPNIFPNLENLASQCINLYQYSFINQKPLFFVPSLIQQILTKSFSTNKFYQRKQNLNQQNIQISENFSKNFLILGMNLRINQIIGIIDLYLRLSRAQSEYNYSIKQFFIQRDDSNQLDYISLLSDDNFLENFQNIIEQNLQILNDLNSMRWLKIGIQIDANRIQQISSLIETQNGKASYFQLNIEILIMLIIENPQVNLLTEFKELSKYIQENLTKDIPELMHVQNQEQKTPMQSPIRDLNTQFTSRQTKIMGNQKDEKSKKTLLNNKSTLIELNNQKENDNYSKYLKFHKVQHILQKQLIERKRQGISQLCYLLMNGVQHDKSLFVDCDMVKEAVQGLINTLKVPFYFSNQ